MTRRHVLLLPVAAQLRAQGLSAQQALLWREFEAAWNPFAADLNNGLFDVKKWKAVSKAFKHLGGCDK